MQHTAELKKIKSELKLISRRKPKKPKTLKEIEKSIEQIDLKIIDILMFEQLIYEDDGKIHFLDVLGLSPRGYIELENELIEKKLEKGTDIEAEIEKSGLDRDKYYLNLVIEELRRRKIYHPNKNRARARERLKEILFLG